MLLLKWFSFSYFSARVAGILGYKFFVPKVQSPPPRGFKSSFSALKTNKYPHKTDIRRPLSDGTVISSKHGARFGSKRAQMNAEQGKKAGAAMKDLGKKRRFRVTKGINRHRIGHSIRFYEVLHILLPIEGDKNGKKKEISAVGPAWTADRA
jgi:hypothetical protein